MYRQNSTIIRLLIILRFIQYYKNNIFYRPRYRRIEKKILTSTLQKNSKEFHSKDHK